MKLTVIQSAITGLVDDEYRPRVFEGHLDKEQCQKIASQYGEGYPTMGFVECKESSEEGSEEAVFYCNFSNDENPPMNGDGTIEDPSKGDLELWFYHTKQEPSPIPLHVMESLTTHEVQDPDDMPMNDEGCERYWGAFEDSPVPHERVWVRFNREPNDQDEAERVAREYFGE